MIFGTGAALLQQEVRPPDVEGAKRYEAVKP